MREGRGGVREGGREGRVREGGEGVREGENQNANITPITTTTTLKPHLHPLDINFN